MAGDRDGDDDDKSSPFSWVLVPIIVFISASTLLLFMRYRRQKRARFLYPSTALRRDIEAMGGHRSQPQPPNSRWQWGDANNAPGRTGRLGRRTAFGQGMASRDEGLNELGEAPPAYAPPSKQSRDGHASEVELADVGDRPQSSGMAPPPAIGTTHSNPPAIANTTNSPPAYSEATNGPISPTLPPRAVVHSS